MKHVYKLLITAVVFSVFSLITSPFISDANAAACPICPEPSERTPCPPCPTKQQACDKCSAESTNNSCKKCSCNACCDYGEERCPTPPTCGKTCKENSECTGAIGGCTICNNGKCSDGNMCGTLCSDNIDCVGGKDGCAYCNKNANPPVCTKDVPHYGKPCDPTRKNNQGQALDCAGALDGSTVCDPSLKKCTNGAMCGKECNPNRELSDDCAGATDGCSVCDPTLKKCTNGKMSGKACNPTYIVCPKANGVKCIASDYGDAVAKCGDGKCYDADCLGATDGATVCDPTLKKCTNGNTCGKPCSRTKGCSGGKCFEGGDNDCAFEGATGGCEYCNTDVVPAMCTRRPPEP